jgi:hypothetical protein
MSNPVTTGLKRVVAASMADTVVEWYEFFLYYRETKGIDLKALDDADADELAAERQAAVG